MIEFWFGIIICLVGLGFIVWQGCYLLAIRNNKAGIACVVFAILLGLALIVSAGGSRPDSNTHSCNCEYCTIDN
jgi:hypothetical protein